MTRDDFIRQARGARETLDKIAKLFPGCFHPNGKPIVASAHFPTLRELNAPRTTPRGNPMSIHPATDPAQYLGVMPTAYTVADDVDGHQVNLWRAFQVRDYALAAVQRALAAQQQRWQCAAVLHRLDALDYFEDDTLKVVLVPEGQPLELDANARRLWLHTHLGHEWRLQAFVPVEIAATPPAEQPHTPPQG